MRVASGPSRRARAPYGRSPASPYLGVVSVWERPVTTTSGRPRGSRRTGVVRPRGVARTLGQPPREGSMAGQAGAQQLGELATSMGWTKNHLLPHVEFTVPEAMARIVEQIPDVVAI